MTEHRVCPVHGAGGVKCLCTAHAVTVHVLGVRLRRQSTNRHWPGHHLLLYTPTFPSRKYSWAHAVFATVPVPA